MICIFVKKVFECKVLIDKMKFRADYVASNRINVYSFDCCRKSINVNVYRCAMPCHEKSCKPRQSNDAEEEADGKAPPPHRKSIFSVVIKMMNIIPINTEFTDAIKPIRETLFNVIFYVYKYIYR